MRPSLPIALFILGVACGVDAPTYLAGPDGGSEDTSGSVDALDQGQPSVLDGGIERDALVLPTLEVDTRSVTSDASSPELGRDAR